jgi:hypothetical protein
VSSESSRTFFQSPPASPVQRFWSSHNVRKHTSAPQQKSALADWARGADVPLVNRHISQRIRQSSPYENQHFDVAIEQYPSDVRVKRGFTGLRSQVGGGRRGTVDAFSEASRRRLAFTARNAFPKLVSQFGMTYHNAWGDGLTVKKHMNRFLNWIRKNLEGVSYLWIFEFQSRGAPHFHLFLSCPASPELGLKLGAAWSNIADRGNTQHLQFHQDERNFVSWDMGSGSYLTKYLTKESQKFVPPDFGWSGRFWGCSRGLVPAPCVHSTLDHSKRDLSRIIRGLGRWHEHKLKRWGRRSHVRSHCYNALIPQASKILEKLLI